MIVVRTASSFCFRSWAPLCANDCSEIHFGEETYASLIPAFGACGVMNSAHSYRAKNEYECYSQFGLGGARLGGVAGELSPASVYVSLLPVVEACVVVPGRVGEVRVPADEPEAVDLDPGVLARRLDAPAAVKAVLEQGGRMPVATNSIEFRVLRR